MLTPPERRGDAAQPPQTASPLFEIRVRIPRSWLHDLDEAASTHAMSRSDLVRQCLRDFLRHRRDDAA